MNYAGRHVARGPEPSVSLCEKKDQVLSGLRLEAGIRFIKVALSPRIKVPIGQLLEGHSQLRRIDMRSQPYRCRQASSRKRPLIAVNRIRTGQVFQNSVLDSVARLTVQGPKIDHGPKKP